MIRSLAFVLVLALSTGAGAASPDAPLDVKTGKLELADGRVLQVEGGAWMNDERLVLLAKEKVNDRARVQKLEDELGARDRAFWKAVAIGVPVVLILVAGAFTVGRATR